MDKVSWVQCDSRNDMLARLSLVDNQVFDGLITEDSNAWGYLTLNKKIYAYLLAFLMLDCHQKFFTR